MSKVKYLQALGRVLRDARKAKRLTTSELHYRVRMSHQAISKIERGTVAARLDTILNICEALEVNPSTMFALAERDL